METKKVKKTTKKLSYYEKQKIIKEISEETNKNITRRYLMDIALGKKKII